MIFKEPNRDQAPLYDPPYVQETAAAVGGALALGSTFNTAHAQGSEEIKVALVGCGGRGTGAVAQMFNTKGNVKLVPQADAFDGNAKRAIDGLKSCADKAVNADTTSPAWTPTRKPSTSTATSS